MTILLLATETGTIRKVREWGAKIGMPVTVRRSYRGSTKLIESLRPKVVINCLMGLDKSGSSMTVEFPDRWRPAVDCIYFDVGRLTLDEMTEMSLVGFLEAMPNGALTSNTKISNAFSVSNHVLKSRNGNKVKGQQRKSAIDALTHAKNVFDGVIGTDSRLIVGDNRQTVPISDDVLETIRMLIDGALAIASAPTSTKSSLSSLTHLRESFKDIERSLNSLNSTLKKSIKTSGLLAALIAAIATVVTQLGYLIGVLMKAMQ